MSNSVDSPHSFEQRVTAVIAVLAGVLLGLGWLIDINERFGTMLGTSLTTIAGVLLGPTVVLFYWVAFRDRTPRLGLIAVLMAAVGTIVMVGAINIPVVARAAGEGVQELMEGTTYTILGITAFILLLVGFILTAVGIYRSRRLSNWIALVVGLAPVVVAVGGPIGIHQVTASGFILLGAGVAAAGTQLWPKSPVDDPNTRSE